MGISSRSLSLYIDEHVMRQNKFPLDQHFRNVSFFCFFPLSHIGFGSVTVILIESFITWALSVHFLLLQTYWTDLNHIWCLGYNAKVLEASQVWFISVRYNAYFMHNSNQTYSFSQKWRIIQWLSLIDCTLITMFYYFEFCYFKYSVISVTSYINCMLICRMNK
jgi:hypothetical protein